MNYYSESNCCVQEPMTPVNDPRVTLNEVINKEYCVLQDLIGLSNEIGHILTNAQPTPNPNMDIGPDKTNIMDQSKTNLDLTIMIMHKLEEILSSLR